MRKHYLAADGQANSRALVLACGMEPLEDLKYAFGIGGIETDAIVRHADLPKPLRFTQPVDWHGIAVDQLCGDGDQGIGVRSLVFYGIQKDVGKDLAHLMRNYGNLRQRRND